MKLANASVAATCIALAPVFTSIIEPWVAKRPFQLRELAFAGGAAGCCAGGRWRARWHAHGCVDRRDLSAPVAVFGSLNKRMVSHADPLTVTALELGAGTLTLTLLAPLMPYLLPALASPLWVVPDLHDGILLLVLAGFCTLLPFALALVALRHLSAYTVQLVTNPEPVYAVVLAVVLLREQHEVTPWFYLGVAIIVGAVFLHPLLNRRKPVQHPEILGTAEARNIAD